jgi:DNA replication protein DnaC
MPVLVGLKSFQTLADPQLESVITYANTFATDMIANRNPRWLSLLGTSGVGKTMLGTLIYEIAKRQKHLQFHPRLNTCWAINSEKWSDVASRFIDEKWLSEYLSIANFLFLDDIGADHDKSGWLANCLYKVLDARVGKWTVLTSNLSLDQIGTRIDNRVASRMIRGNSQVVDVDTIDFNLRRK